jgi:DNA mismatch repair protein MSH3
MPDVERGITRLFHRTATPSEFVSVVQALLQVSRRLSHVPVSKGHVAASGASSGDEADGGTGAAVKAPLLRRLLAAATSATVVREAKKLLAGVDASAAKSAPASEKTNLFVCENGRFPEVRVGVFLFVSFLLLPH